MIAFALLLPLLMNADEGRTPPLGQAKRVLVLGDSITAAGHYTAYMEAFFRTRYPDRELEWINLGLPSEGVTGLSEPRHPWPRPNVHERLDRALTTIKPDVVLACYGMNDGIYHPFSEERFAKYQDGILKLVARCREQGIRVYLITPPPFDAQPVARTLQMPDAKEFGWTGTYYRYEDEVLRPYATWIRSFLGVNFTPIDTHEPIRLHLEAARKDDKAYGLSGDGVHMDESGHWLIAQAILESWNVPKEVETAEIDAKSLTVVKGDIRDLKADSGGLKFSWTTKIPMPHDPRWNDKIANAEGIDARLNRHRLIVTGLDRDSYTLYEGNRAVGRASRAELAEGLDLLKFPELSTNVRAKELGELVAQKERILSPAWLDKVGHKRPDTAKGLPMDKALSQAKPLDEQIRKLAQPSPLELRLVP